MFLAQCLLEPLRTQDPVTGLEGSWAERRGTLSQGNLTWPGSSPGSTLGSCSLCSVASVSSSLLRMMVWVGGRAGGRAVGATAFLPSGLWSRWMWNLRCPLRLKLKGEDGRPSPGGQQWQLTWLSDATRCWTIWPSAVVISWI